MKETTDGKAERLPTRIEMEIAAQEIESLLSIPKNERGTSWDSAFDTAHRIASGLSAPKSQSDATVRQQIRSITKWLQTMHQLSKEGGALKVSTDTSLRGVEIWTHVDTRLEGMFIKNEPWSFYGLSTPEAVRAHIHEQNARFPHSKSIGADVMGQGYPCADAGCAETIAITALSRQKRHTVPEHPIHTVVGNLYVNTVRAQFLQELGTLIQKDGRLDLVFFRPLSGLPKINDPYALAYLFDHLFVPLYTKLAPGGIMFVEMHEIYSAGTIFFELLKDAGLTIERRSEKNGDMVRDCNTFCIRKVEGAPESIPSLLKLAQSHPAYIKKFWNMIHMADDIGIHPHGPF